MRNSVALAVLATLLATPALAHAFLASASPAVGSTVRVVPGTLILRFTEGVEPAFCAIEVRDVAGHRVDTGGAHLGAGGDTSLVAPLQPLQPGPYTVVWRVTSTDTHKTSGRFTFTVSP